MRNIQIADTAIRTAALGLAALLTTAVLASMDLVAAQQYDRALVAHQRQADAPRMAAGPACVNKG